MKAANQIIEALTQLVEGYNELQAMIETDYAADSEEEEIDGHSTPTVEVDEAMVTELRATIEAVMDGEDYSSEEVAAVLSSLSEALEEIDPDVFESESDDDDDEEDEDDEDKSTYDASAYDDDEDDSIDYDSYEDDDLDDEEFDDEGLDELDDDDY